MRRQLEPEWLDELPVDAEEAVRSRRDLRRINAWMGNAGILARALRTALDGRPLRTLVELGAGDGRLLLEVVQRLNPPGPPARVLLLDRLRLVTPETQAAFGRSGWRADPVSSDVLEWLRQAGSGPIDAVVANLFLHHFNEHPLRELLGLAAQRTAVFVAVEPRRSPLARAFSRLLWAIRCNAVTRHDAAVSVQAGFVGQELSALWPSVSSHNWKLTEHRAGLFSHLFVAQLRP